MFNLYQIITGAQGGQGIENLAQQFGLSREQADRAVQSLVPALSTAFMTSAAHPGGLSAIMGAMGDDQHKQAYADPNVAQAPTTQQKGTDVAGSIFGNNAIVQQVVRQAAQYTGIPEATIQQMLPVVISMVLGGVATAMHNQGLGGILGQLAGSLGGGASAPGQQPGQAPAGGGFGGFGGMFGSILSNMLGGAQHASPQQPAPQAPQATPQPSGMPGMPPAFQAGMEALGKMFQPGVHPQPGQPGSVPGDLSAQISSILGGGSKR